MAAAAVIIPLVIAAAGAAQQFDAANTERKNAEIAAKQQELQVIQREGDRKDRLASAISSQNAFAGASGIRAFEGSPLTVLEDSLERERVATERDVFNTQLSAHATRFRGRARRSALQQKATLGLVQAGASFAQTGFNSGS